MRRRLSASLRGNAAVETRSLSLMPSLASGLVIWSQAKLLATGGLLPPHGGGNRNTSRGHHEHHCQNPPAWASHRQRTARSSEQALLTVSAPRRHALPRPAAP